MQACVISDGVPLPGKWTILADDYCPGICPGCSRCRPICWNVFQSNPFWYYSVSFAALSPFSSLPSCFAPDFAVIPPPPLSARIGRCVFASWFRHFTPSNCCGTVPPCYSTYFELLFFSSHLEIILGLPSMPVKRFASPGAVPAASASASLGAVSLLLLATIVPSTF